MAKEMQGRNEKLSGMIGEDLQFEGILRGKGLVRIDGKVDGDRDLAGDVHIGETGIVKVNEIRANEVIVAGRLEGNVNISGKLELSKTGIVIGEIGSKLLYLEEGGKISGKIDMINEVNNSKILLSNEEEAVEKL